MLKRILTSAALAGGLAFAGIGAASAATVMTETTVAPTDVAYSGGSVVNTAYECDIYGNCGWAPNYAPMPYAQPAPGYLPAAPGCHWHQGLLGNWKQRC
jgi:hypothetical protein